MSRDSHIIQRAIVELLLPSADNAFATQNKAADIFKREILPMIERTLDELDVKGEVIRLDKLALNVNLGRDDLSDPVFLEKIKTKLRDQLEKAVEEARRSTQTLKEFGKIKKVSAEYTDEELFLYLLQHGRLPWWIGTRDKIKLDVLAEKVLEKPSAEFKAKLMVQMNRAEVAKRSVHKLSAENFSSLISLVFPQAANALEIIQKFQEIVELYYTGNDSGRKLYEQLLKEMTQNNTLPLQIISEFIIRQNSVKLAQQVYLHINESESGSVKVFSDAIKQAIALTDIYYEGRIRKFFSKEDTGKYFTKGDDAGKNKEKKTSASKEDIHSKNNRLNSEEELHSLPDAEENETYHVHNAGVIILATFLPAFFKEMDLVEEEKFRSPEHAERAAYLIQHLVTGGESGFEEHEMLLNKILCGIEISEPLALEFELSEKEREEAESLLNAVASHWSALRGSSGESMRQTFFNREASLEPQSNGWNMRIERQTFDILVDKLPWSISLIKLPWMKGALFVDW